MASPKSMSFLFLFRLWKNSKCPYLILGDLLLCTSEASAPSGACAGLQGVEV